MKRFWREFPAILFLLSSFAVAFWIIANTPENIPLHFNAQGEIDRWGESWTIIGLPLIALALYGLLTLIQHRPQWCNYPVKITDENREQAYRQMSRIICHIKSLVICLFLYITLGVAQVVEINIFLILAFAFTIPFIIVTGWSKINSKTPQ